MIIYDVISESELLSKGKDVNDTFGYQVNELISVFFDKLEIKIIIFYIIPILLIIFFMTLILICLYKKNKLIKNILDENIVQRKLLERIEINTFNKKDTNK